MGNYITRMTERADDKIRSFEYS